MRAEPGGWGARFGPVAQRLTAVLFVLGLALASACATGNPYEDEGPAEVELLLTNEYRTAMSAYVQWRRAGPTRLGEVSGGESIMVRTPVRGQELRVFFVPLGRTTGEPSEAEYASAQRGDRFEWVLRSDRSVFYLRY
jgi:hypothetical protein